jgi:PrtD family type I secretion system ABC transporter
MATGGIQSAVYPLLKHTLAACRGGFMAVGLFSFAINLLLLTIPLYMLQLFDRVLTSRSEDTLFALSIAAGGAILTLAALEAVRSFVMVRLSNWLDTQLSGDLLGGSVIDGLARGGEASVQGLRDLLTFRTFLTGPAIFPFLDAPWTPVFIAVIFLFHPLLGWLSIAGAAVLFAMALINEFSTRNLLMQSGGASIKSLRVAESAVRNADVIEAMGMMPNIVRRWRQENSAMLELQAKASQRSAAITATSRFFRLFLQVAMLGVGAWLAINDEVSPGAMIAGSILLGRALAPVEQAIGSWKSAVAARGAYTRIKRQLDTLAPRAESMALPAPAGQLSVEGMSYLYPGATEAVLRSLDFRLEPGESVGLIGPTAVGKTTLARLAVGNLRPSSGHIRLDTADVAQWDPVDLGQYIGYLPQDVELFAGTVRQNIARMGDGDPEEVVAAAQLAGVHEIILGLPAGYETEIGEGGAVLSGGQRQRIGLARAVFGNPKFIVLDEPNANLDHEGEVALLETVSRLKAQGVTMVIIAHRPSVLRNVDKILVLRNGSIQMFGARDEVMAKLAAPAAAAPATLDAAPVEG